MANHLFSSLNPQQQKAVIFGNGPLLVLAGAGSGKTRVLTHRVAYLVGEKKVNPQNILCITFTNKAAEEMRERLQKLLPNQSLPFTGTFHAFCVSVLRREAEAIGLSPHFVIWDETDQLAAIRKILKEKGQDYQPSSILATISQAKNELISAFEYPQYARNSFQELAAEFYLSYQKELKLAQALDFDDLLLETVRLFQNHPEILGKYQERYQYIFVDEYQDTNAAQYFLTKALASRHQNLFVVGDMSQSIYSWRGADYRNVLRLKDDFPNLTVINLEQNYRSTQNILDAAYGIISQNHSHPVLHLWTQKKKGEKINLYNGDTEEDEAHFVAEKILELTTSGYQNNQIAVLYRTNAQSRILEEVLLHYNINYKLIGGVRFYERREIKDILAFLRALVNPEDSLSWQRIEKIGKRIKRKWEKVIQEDNPSQNLESAKLVKLALEKSGYLEKLNPEKEEDLSRIENLKELISVAQSFPNIDDFLANIALMEEEYFPQGKFENQSNQNPAVNLMTLHRAKGTEFPIVFITGLEEGLLPHYRAISDPQELEEERRLCYVGLTRAQEKLFLTLASRRLLFGKKSSNPPSRFLSNIPENLINLVNY
ncbi:UvrD-helicase domain-containing protein [Candidatus Shapirobacteria bacterium]|nr:UvrD-helicase domain-containing protein [Candidatus Shapirobacteria bacterium]